MKIVYAGLQREKFDSRLGFSFEHNNFYESLRRLPDVKVVYFPYEKILELGREKGNTELLELVKKEKPDLFFAFMLSDEIDKKTLSEIKNLTTSIAWFADDHWRFDNYSKYYAPHFSWVVTTDSNAPERYKEFGITNVIHSQWAANTQRYQPILADERFGPDVSFVGGWNRPRQKIISALRKAGIKVEAYGAGWPAGRISEERMIELFSTSKINLALNPAPGYFNVNSLGRLFFRRSMDKIVPDFHFGRNFKSWLHRGIPQIKARHFEIPACGGFLITAMADNLGDYYKIGEEIIIYENIPDLIGKIRYFLENDVERKKIAAAGHRQTVADNSYEHCFRKIFKKIGLI